MSMTTVWLPWKRWSTQCVFYRTSLVWFFLSLHASDGLNSACKTANCFHDSPCQIVENLGIFTTKCLCPLGWVGTHCQGKFYITITSVSMTTVTLTTSTTQLSSGFDVGYKDDIFQPLSTKLFQTGSRQADIDDARTFLDIASQSNQVDTEVQYPEYSIQYWSRNQSHLCNILPKTFANTITVSGLRRNTDYIFCAKTSQIKQCNFDLVKQHSDVSYCVSVRTTSVDNVLNENVPKLSLIILASFAVICLIFLVVIVIYAIRRKYLCTGTHVKQTYTTSSREEMSRTYTIDPHMESLLLHTPVKNRNVTIHKPNQPGKPEHRLVQKRMRGYAAFSARNEQTIALSTVIEYGMPEEDIEVCKDNRGEHLSNLENPTESMAFDKRSSVQDIV